jgi:autotransporter-associated beta strand protein
MRNSMAVRRMAFSKSSKRLLAAVASVGLLGGWAGGATLTWDGGDAMANTTFGGSGTWDTNVSTNWTVAGPTETTWTDTTGVDTAVFTGTAGNVSIASGGVTANQLTFSSAGFTLSGGTLTLGGATPTITNNAASTIATSIAGGSGVSQITIVGNGVSNASDALTLTSANAFTGTFLVSGTGPGAGGNNYSNVSLSLANTSSTTANPTIAGSLTVGDNGNIVGVRLGAANQFSSSSILTLGGSTYVYVYLDTSQTVGGIATTNGNAQIEVSGPNDGTSVSYGTQTLTLAGSGNYSFAGTLRNHDTNNNGGNVLALVKSGSGTQTLSGGNLSYTGTTQINGGVLSLAGALSTSGISFGGGTLQYNGTNTDYSAKITGSTSAISIDTGGQSVTFGTALAASNTAGLTKLGTGTLTLSKANLYTGTTTVSAGTLALNFAATGATPTNILNSSYGLNLAGGSLTVTGNASTTNSQSLSGLTVSPGAATVVLTANATANPLLLSLGAITNAGGTVDFTLPTGTQSATNGIRTSSSGSNAILGGYATVGGTTWAAISGGNIVPLATYGSDYTLATSATDFDVLSSGTFTPTGINSLRFNTAGAFTSTLNGAFAIGSGGILETAAVGANATVITGGTSLTSGNGVNLIVNQANTGGSLSINTPIVGSIALTKAGAGTLVLGAASSYTGRTYLAGGTTQLGSPTALGPASTAAITFSPGTTSTLLLNGNSLVVNDLTATGATPTIQNGSTTAATLTINNSIADTYTGNISNGSSGTLSLTKSGAGTLSLSGTGITYTGATTISAGTLSLQDTTVFASPIAVGAAGTLNLNRTALGFANRSTIAASAITGSGTINVNNAGSGVAGGWVTMSGGNALNFSGTININSGVFATDNSGTVQGSAAGLSAGSTARETSRPLKRVIRLTT